MIVSKNKVDRLQRLVCFKDEIANQYQRLMVSLATENGDLQAKLLLANAEISRLNRELDALRLSDGKKEAAS